MTKLVVIGLVCWIAAVSAYAGEPPLESGVLAFFSALQNGGTIEVDQTIEKAYAEYDHSPRPTPEALERAAGIDIAAYVFRANLSRTAHYSDEATSTLIARQDQRLARFYSERSERQAIMVAWLKRAKDRMMRFYQDSAPHE